MRSAKVQVVLAAVVAVICGSAMAVTIVEDTWGGAEGGWDHRTEMGSPGTTLYNPTNFSGEGALGIVGGDGFGDHRSSVYTDDADFVGQWNQASGPDGGGTMGDGDDTVRRIVFDFYSETTNAGLLRLYFIGGASDYVWYYDLTPTVLGWHTYEANMLAEGPFGGWYSPAQGASGLLNSTLWNDLATVDEVGIYLAYQPNFENQIYGIDNFELNDEYHTPEPGTVAALGFALVSLAIVFRKELNGKLEHLRQLVGG